MAVGAVAVLAIACLCSALQASAAAAVEAAEAAVAAHAARGALAALADVDAAEAGLVAAEQAVIASAAAGPLEAYSPVHDAVGLLLDAALGALRHALAAGVAAKGEQQQAAALERQLAGLLSAQVKEPLFFWHGPKWLLLAKLRAIFNSAGTSGGPSLRDRLKVLAAKQPAGATTIEQLVGDIRSGSRAAEELSDSAKSSGSVPTLGVAVGDAECGEAAGGSPEPACELVGPLSEAAAKIGRTANRQPKRAGTRELLRISWSSLALWRPSFAWAPRCARTPRGCRPSSSRWWPRVRPARTVNVCIEVLVGPKQLQPWINKDLLWLPYSAFKKKQWPEVRPLLERLLKRGTIGAYGVHAEARSKVLAGKLLDRKPKPAAWLKQHDLLRPSESEAVSAARSLGLRVVALPRTAGIPSSLASVYLEAAAGPDVAAQEAAQLRWTLQQGLAATLRLGARAAPAAVAALQRLGATRLAPGAPQLLAAPGTFCNPEPRLHSSRGLEGALERGRRSAAYNAAAEQLPPVPPAVPGVSPASLDAVHQQQALYKANNHVIYKEDFFDPDTFAAIAGETKRLWRSEDIEANCNLDGVDRLGGYVLDHNTHNSSLYRLIYGNEAFRRWVSAVNGEGEMWPADFPIELREYGLESRGMACHPDLQMYAVPKKDIEFVVTVDNDSSCNISYTDARGIVHEVHTRANSLMMVRVNAAVHCVSPTSGGTRTILKFIFVGDYRKSAEFWSYTDNACDDTNRNRQTLRQRREAGAGAEVRAAGNLEL